MIAAILAGAVGATALVAYFGFHAVVLQLMAVGVGPFGLVAGVQVVILCVAGWAWRLLLSRPSHSSRQLIRARLIREAVSELLPFSAIGGYLMSARVLGGQNAHGVDAIASLIVDVTLEVTAQIAFAFVALGALVRYDPHSPLIGPIAIGLAAIAAGTAALYVMQRRRIGLLWRKAQSLLDNLLGSQHSRADAVEHRINRIYRQRWRPAAGFLLHFGCWIAGAAEIWLALKFMGVSLGVGSVIAIEGLISVVNGAAFIVPNAIGVQEGGYVALGAVFGLAPESALALSLLKRSRDLVVGLPVLVLWQAVEARQFWLRLAPSRHRARAQRQHPPLVARHDRSKAPGGGGAAIIALDDGRD